MSSDTKQVSDSFESDVQVAEAQIKKRQEAQEIIERENLVLAEALAICRKRQSSYEYFH